MKLKITLPARSRALKIFPALTKSLLRMQDWSLTNLFKLEKSITLCSWLDLKSPGVVAPCLWKNFSLKKAVQGTDIYLERSPLPVRLFAREEENSLLLTKILADAIAQICPIVLHLKSLQRTAHASVRIWINAIMETVEPYFPTALAIANHVPEFKSWIPRIVLALVQKVPLNCYKIFKVSSSL